MCTASMSRLTINTRLGLLLSQTEFIQQRVKLTDFLALFFDTLKTAINSN